MREPSPTAEHYRNTGRSSGSQGALKMRSAFTALFVAALFAVPFVSGAAPLPPPISIKGPPPTATITTYAYINNGSGFAVTSCPLTVSYQGAIIGANWPGHPVGGQIPVQYKWIHDGVAGSTLTMVALNGQTGSLSNPQTWTRTPGSPTSLEWTLSANGRHWIAFQIISPSISNNTSNHATFTLTCPTTVNGKKVPGSFTASPWLPQ
jgi:hypothetical protein